MRVDRRSAAGQVLVLFIFGFFAIIAMVALVVDGGNAFAQQRATQNATDAAAEAGAAVLGENISRVLNGATPHTNADVAAAITNLAGLNSVAIDVADYTDIDGNVLGADHLIGGTSPLTPTDTPPSNASGVAVTSSRPFGTYFARAIGISSITATTDATAIAGYRSGKCDVATGCVLLPVTIPINIITCDGQNDPQIALPPTHWGKYIVYRIPLCKNGPGNVGWLDWTPPNGGESELVDAIIPPPYSPPIDLPSWQFVTETGNVNAATVENALRYWDGQVVMIPIFDNTCDATPTGPGILDCPAGHTGGNGQNQWYHFPEAGAFQLCDPSVSGCAGFDHGAYVNGINKNICEVGGNGATSCLVGKFVDFSIEGTVGNVGTEPIGPSAIIAVQLIK